MIQRIFIIEFMMEQQKAALTKAIAVLLSVTPETPVGKLLKLCLEAKVEEQVAGKTSLQMAQEFIDKPDSIAYWMQDVIGADGEFKAEEWQALGELGITDTEQFLKDFWAELEGIELSK
ncbi:MAG: hypothetical protein ACFCAD_09355 [Pleurocapsa sp.]